MVYIELEGLQSLFDSKSLTSIVGNAILTKISYLTLIYAQSKYRLKSNTRRGHEVAEEVPH